MLAACPTAALVALAMDVDALFFQGRAAAIVNFGYLDALERLLEPHPLASAALKRADEAYLSTDVAQTHVDIVMAVCGSTDLSALRTWAELPEFQLPNVPTTVFFYDVCGLIKEGGPDAVLLYRMRLEPWALAKTEGELSRVTLPADLRAFALRAEVRIVQLAEELPTGEVCALLAHFAMFYDRETIMIHLHADFFEHVRAALPQLNL